MNRTGKTLLLIMAFVLACVGGYFVGTKTTGVAVPEDNFSTEGMKLDSQESAELIENIQRYMKTIDQDFLFPVNREQIEEGIYKGIFESLDDPYSVYYNPEEYKALMEETDGEFAGIGIVVTAEDSDTIRIVSPIEGTPGMKAGLQAGDVILAIDGEHFPGSQLNEATTKMKGEPGTDVTLTIERETNGKKEQFDVTITRDMIHVDSVETKLLEDKIGYLRISSFDTHTAEEFQKKLMDLESQGAEALILDLRNNPGGLLNVATDIADYLLDEKVIVSTADKHGKKEAFYSDPSKDPIPMVVLVNGGSASASEILLGALMDNGRAKSIGEKTFGKGIVQRIYPVETEKGTAGFKLTVQEYMTPNGSHIHEVGITPDILVELPKETKLIGLQNVEGDTQLQKALEEARKLIK